MRVVATTTVREQTVRDHEDACPGAFRPHHAMDGELLRLRLPGGALSRTALSLLAAASAALADGRIGLTSRGNIQVRGVTAENVPELLEAIRQARLLPAPEHERVRNIIASPLSGRSAGSVADVDQLVDDLDAGLCARSGLSQLPGRFLFAIDDGCGDVSRENADVLAIALGDGSYAVRPAGLASGVTVAAAQTVAAVLATAEAFLAERAAQGGQAWRVKELTAGGERLLSRLLAAGWPAEPAPGEVGPELSGSIQPGLVEQVEGLFAVCAVVPLGMITAEQAAALAAAAELAQAPDEGPTVAMRMTPWRRVVIRDLELPAALAVRELLSSAGLVLDPATAWSRITACAGRPGCARSLTDVHADATAFAAAAHAADAAELEGWKVHWAGCERGCGTPAGRVVQILATADGYRTQHGDQLSVQDRRAIALVSERRCGDA